ncbi:uncharacterized protein LOC124455088 isoform X2 [Xenia sp. Carnegie-2017]|uniref:uncharacterized protein LOC124455088 isoform X2 n=1 Tax=Xenia sp. Carnegie-2017 TaxID=2897299 RepID=UPI001F03EB1A|nr:uncharacterized protein LOC124455088 isoform X2 [Xenia sp. Carnegie-2017]
MLDKVIAIASSLFVVEALLQANPDITSDAYHGESSEGATFVPESMANEVMEREVLLIHRCNVKADLLHYFEKDDILKKCMDVKMIDSRGVEEKGEGVGVVRLSLLSHFFWAMFSILQSYKSSINFGYLSFQPR